MRPKAQRVYIDVTDGTVGRFDSWTGPHTGFYRLSTGSFIRLPPARMRKATPSEARMFDRAESTRAECAIRGF